LSKATKSADAAGNNWLELTASGDPDNRTAIGARAEILSGGQRQSWEVSGASGYLGQGSPEILLGLGAESLADVVRILWPNGLIQDELQVPADQRNKVIQPEQTAK
jgi:hypothetical protein